MTNFFLRAKSWHLFMLSFGLPILLQIFMVMSGIFSALTETDFLVVSYFTIFPIMMLLFVGTLFCWFWSVAMGLQPQITSRVKMKVTKFKFFFFIPLAYMIFLMVFMALTYGGSFSNDKENLAGFIGLIIMLHLFSMFCMLYCLYFVSKTLRTAELQREVFFNDFAGDFFLIWFYPIGVWIIQPRVNKFAEIKS